MIVAGSIITGIGVLFITGGVLQFGPHAPRSYGCGDSCAAINSIGLSLFLGVGITAAVVGLPLLAVGGSQYSSSTD